MLCVNLDNTPDRAETRRNYVNVPFLPIAGSGTKWLYLYGVLSGILVVTDDRTIKTVQPED